MALLSSRTRLVLHPTFGRLDLSFRTCGESTSWVFPLLSELNPEDIIVLGDGQLPKYLRYVSRFLEARFERCPCILNISVQNNDLRWNPFYILKDNCLTLKTHLWNGSILFDDIQVRLIAEKTRRIMYRAMMAESAPLAEEKGVEDLHVYDIMIPNFNMETLVNLWEKDVISTKKYRYYWDRSSVQKVYTWETDTYLPSGDIKVFVGDELIGSGFIDELEKGQVDVVVGTTSKLKIEKNETEKDNLRTVRLKVFYFGETDENLIIITNPIIDAEVSPFPIMKDGMWQWNVIVRPGEQEFVYEIKLKEKD